MFLKNFVSWEMNWFFSFNTYGVRGERVREEKAFESKKSSWNLSFSYGS